MLKASFDIIQKKLDKKNAELANVRATRKKLADKERQISAEIDSLQNKKVELVFLQVKKQVKTENLDISSSSVLLLLEVLRNNNQLNGLETLADEKIFSTEEKGEGEEVSRVNSN